MAAGPLCALGPSKVPGRNLAHKETTTTEDWNGASQDSPVHNVQRQGGSKGVGTPMGGPLDRLHFYALNEAIGVSSFEPGGGGRISTDKNRRYFLDLFPKLNNMIS